MATSPPQDSELAHSFGPQEIGFDYLPLELTPPEGFDLRTQPAPQVPTIDLASDGPLAFSIAEVTSAAANGNGAAARRSSATAARDGVAAYKGKFWLEGDVLMCACPECQAPMSVRLWLLAADCWQCGTSIELTEEQEREAQRLLEQRRQEITARAAAPPPPPRAAAPQALAPPPPVPRAPAPRPQPTPAAVPAGAESAAPPVARRRAAPARRRVHSSSRWLHNLLKDTPAWLISMVVHMIGFTLMALLNVAPNDDDGPFILLSSMIAPEPDRGGDTVDIPPDEAAKFDLPIPNKSDLRDPQQRQVLLAAAQDALDLRLDEVPPNLPDVEQVRKLIGHPDGIRSTMAARDPRLRVEMVTREGGTTLTEAAVARGLRWLANHQNADGSWGLSDFQQAGRCNCGGHGAIGGKSAGTALAMLPFLGAGQTQQAGKYKDVVARGLNWMLANQAKDGDLRGGSRESGGMYSHGQATIVLCEAFAMTGDEKLRVPAQKAVDFIVKAQYRDGGWRYDPGPPQQFGDTSVVGWQLMALQSARAANLTVPEETLEMAQHFLDGVQSEEGARYAYQRSRDPTPVMTAEALLCRMYLGWNKRNTALGQGVRWLAESYPPEHDRPNIYYWYYATQTLHHFGGPEWDEWNLRMRDVLVDTQETQGHRAGSWSPRGEHAGAGGRIYMTSLAICSLEVYYRHLPIFKRIELDETATAAR
ncbi:MAG TPA: prenyltransferase/squalene oxidase repeat-containing protein [Pirellulaceae bacterium]|nr:prenyltransferase/squalene oxidase repeat-containing protein [Pirellulaceae bacterium]